MKLIEALQHFKLSEQKENQFGKNSLQNQTTMRNTFTSKSIAQDKKECRRLLPQEIKQNEMKMLIN